MFYPNVDYIKEYGQRPIVLENIPYSSIWWTHILFKYGYKGRQLDDWNKKVMSDVKQILRTKKLNKIKSKI